MQQNPYRPRSTSVRLLALQHTSFFPHTLSSSNWEIQEHVIRAQLQKHKRKDPTMGLLWRHHAWKVRFSEAQLIFQHNAMHTRPMCVSMLVLFFFILSWPGGAGDIVLTVNIGEGRGNLAKPVGNYSVHAHKKPRLWFMALPLGHGFYLHLWLLYKLHYTITTATDVEWLH